MLVLPGVPGRRRALRRRAATGIFRPVARFAPLVLLLVAAAPPPAAPAAEQFFVGRTEGVGIVSVILSGRHGVRDRSHGRIEQGGILVLDQIVEEEGKPARRTSWRLGRSGGNRIRGSISDARGPVTGEVAGNVIHLRYLSGEGPNVEQQITLEPGGRTASNRMTFRRFGFTVATLESTIRRLD
jgi:hypothetical protein